VEFIQKVSNLSEALKRRTGKSALRSLAAAQDTLAWFFSMRYFRRISVNTLNFNTVARGAAFVLMGLSLGLASAFGGTPSVLYDLLDVETDAGKVTRVYGSIGNGGAGTPVAGGYDMDGDGHNDFAMASIQANPFGRSGAGQVFLVFGDGTIGGFIDTSVVQARVLRIAGDQNREVTGAEIWMDDVTGDGLGDLLICRQNHTDDSQRRGAGALTILIGGPEVREFSDTLATMDLRSPPGTLTLVNFFGADEYDRLGIWVRTGDVDGDGIADIVVGADETDGPGRSVSHNEGAVYVIRGGSHLENAVDIDLGSFGSTAMEGHIALIHPPNSGAGGNDDDHMGATCAIADLDGNGRAEVLAAASLNRSGAGLRLTNPNPPSGTSQSSGGTSDGTLYIVWDGLFPSGLWPAGYELEVGEPNMDSWSIIDGESDNAEFAEEIVGGLDYNGDGAPDLLVGDLIGRFNGSTRGTGFVIYSAGELKGMDFSMNNPPSGLDFTFISGPGGDSISVDTVAHGDFDNDGIADLAVGNPHDDPLGRSNAGSVHVLYGRVGGWPAEIDLSPNNLPSPSVMRIVEIDGAKGGDVLCYSAADGDIDGDGHTDFIVNEMTGDGLAPGTSNDGNLLVISGASLIDAPVPSITFSVGEIEFGGQVLEDGPTAMQTVMLTNNGGASLDITSLNLIGPHMDEYEIISDSGETTLAPVAQRVVEIAFDPSTPGVRFAALAQGNDADNEQSSVTLRGIGHRAPLAVDDEATAFEDTAVTIDIAGNDSDPDGDDFMVVANTAPLHGAVIDNGDGTVRYTPTGGYIGPDAFTYTIEDDFGAQGGGTVSVIVKQSFDTWKGDFFDPITEVDISGPADDPDNDNRTNEYEFLFALNPRGRSDRDTFPAADVVGNRLRITYSRSRLVDDVIWAYELSDDLAGWVLAVAEIDFTEVSASDNGDGSETVTVEFLADLTVIDGKFVRVRAVKEE